MDTRFTHQTIRQGLIEFAKAQPYTHAMTLNSDRQLSRDKIESIFGTFCLEMDRVMLATHPYRTLWPLWADALFLLGIRS